MKKKNAIGAVIMAAAILASIPLGVNRSFYRMSQKVQDQYYYDGTGYAVWEGLEIRQGQARNLLTVAGRYADGDRELSGYMDELDHAVKLSENYWFTDIRDVGQAVSYNYRMGEAVRALADQLEARQLSEKDSRYPGRIMAAMDSEQDKLKRSSFNDEAIAYNRKLREFPACLLKGIAGVKEITPFGPGGTGDDSYNYSEP